MTIRDRSQDVDKELQPVYRLLDEVANQIGEQEVSELLRLWLKNHSAKPDRDEYTIKDAIKAFKRQKGICPYCYKPLVDPRYNNGVEPAEQTTCDHLEPASQGGRNNQPPIACHRRCNSRKGDRDLHFMSKRTGMTTLEMLERMRIENAESAD